jgi:hypothetical protein
MAFLLWMIRTLLVTALRVRAAGDCCLCTVASRPDAVNGTGVGLACLKLRRFADFATEDYRIGYDAFMQEKMPKFAAR